MHGGPCQSEAYKTKLQEVHAAYKKAKHKQQELWVSVNLPLTAFPNIHPIGLTYLCAHDSTSILL